MWIAQTHNTVLPRTEFYVSYNPRVSGKEAAMLDRLLNTSTYGGEETAIIFFNEEILLLLSGDHRKNLEACGDDPEAAITYWLRNPQDALPITYGANHPRVEALRRKLFNA